MFKLLFLLIIGFVCSADVLDFTLADPFSQANGKQSWSVTHLGYDLTLTAKPTGARLTWNPGLGITYAYQYQDKPDQVDYPEILTVEFARPTVLNSFTVGNMFWQALSGLSQERGQYSTDGGKTWLSFWGGQNRSQVIAAGNTVTKTISFAVNRKDQFSSDYTVTMLNVSHVPEGSSVALLGMVATAALLVIRRRTS